MPGGSHLDGAGHITSAVRHDLLEGRFSHRLRLPSERDLCALYGVPRRMLRSALHSLEKEGLLYRVERSGTFLSRFRRPAEGAEALSHLRCVTVIAQERRPQQLHFAELDLLAGYTDALEGHDMKLRFAILPSSPDVEPHYESLLSETPPMEEQGCILEAPPLPDLMAWLHTRKVSFVVMGYYDYPSVGLPDHHGVHTNQTGGVFEAARYLASLGHTNIGFIGPLPGGRLPADAYEGYRAWLISAGLPRNPNYLLDFSTDVPELAVEPAKEFLSRRDRPTAIVARTDSVALGALRAAKSLGIRVPKELSIIGYNDQREASESDPPLTTIATPRRHLARSAIEMLLAASEGKYDSFQTQMLNCRLVIRESTSPV